MTQFKVLLLAGNTLRARSYAQKLATFQGILVSGIFYGFDESKCDVPNSDQVTQAYLNRLNVLIPDYEEPLEETFRKNDWKFEYITTKEVNSDDVLDAIRKHDADIVVFAGYGGQILKQNHFKSSAHYLHMHPGSLPMERGSTTLYYSILNGRNFTVTAFFMTADIDAGQVVLKKEYILPPSGVDVDRYVDNCLRADCFGDAIKILAGDKLNQVDFYDKDAVSEEFYIIHPVLKHIALLSLG